MKLARIKPITDLYRQVQIYRAHRDWLDGHGLLYRDLDDPFDVDNIGTGSFYLDPNYRGR